MPKPISQPTFLIDEQKTPTDRTENNPDFQQQPTNRQFTRS